jgi:hypothetical protein
MPLAVLRVTEGDRSTQQKVTIILCLEKAAACLPRHPAVACLYLVGTIRHKHKQQQMEIEMKLNVKSFALTCGIVWGLGLFFLTWWFIAFDGATGEPTLIGKLCRRKRLW